MVTKAAGVAKNSMGETSRREETNRECEKGEEAAGSAAWGVNRES